MRSTLLLIIILFSLNLNAAHDAFHTYIAVGQNINLDCIRIGSHEWELGKLNKSYGFDKIFDLNESFYSTFGFAYVTDFGVISSMGYKTKLWFIPFRLELSGYIDIKGSSYGSGLIGVTYGF